MNHLLQVCNVGNIVGGTAACAWTVTRCLPDWRHTVAFLSEITLETRREFADCRVERWKRVTRNAVRNTAADVVLLHNTHAAQCDSGLAIPSVMYRHSTIDAAAADVTIACSRWLATRVGLPADAVAYQAVPRPPLSRYRIDTRSLRVFPVIGRICTPQPHKWPAETVPFYRTMSTRFPHVQWEFVGCPPGMQPGLQEACRGRAVFHPAGFPARSLLWRWDAMLYHNPHVTESFGRTVAETMRAGCIPIVNNRGGFREQMTPGCGFLCDDLSEFHAAVNAISSPAVRFELSHRCREHGDAAFSLRGFRKRLLRIFESTTRTQASGAASTPGGARPVAPHPSQLAHALDDIGRTCACDEPCGRN